jgi:Fe-S-cluster-containing dehydrogenase component
MEKIMTKAFTFDVSKCNGCFNCQLACKDEHADNDWTPYAKPQPEIGQFWIRLAENVRGTKPKVRIHYMAHLCNHCEKPSCIGSCGQGAIYKREDGIVIIDPEKCNGCGACIDACPYDVIFKNDDLDICQKCTGCTHILDNGYEQPRCVEACPTGALGWGERDELSKFITGAQVMKPEEGTKPQVFYRNIPGRFIAGTLYDPVVKEVIIGARCRLSSGFKTWEAISDNYGDFWFNDLAEGFYELIIGAEGYDYKTYEEIDATDDVNLGDIALDKE